MECEFARCVSRGKPQDHDKGHADTWWKLAVTNLTNNSVDMSAMRQLLWGPDADATLDICVSCGRWGVKGLRFALSFLWQLVYHLRLC